MYISEELINYSSSYSRYYPQYGNMAGVRYLSEMASLIGGAISCGRLKTICLTNIVYDGLGQSILTLNGS